MRVSVSKFGHKAALDRKKKLRMGSQGADKGRFKSVTLTYDISKQL
jgi:hypothetical protein